PGNRQTQKRPLDCQTETLDLSLQRTRLHYSRVQWWCALHHCIRCFACFGVIPLTVDHGIFSRMEISRVDLLLGWQPITVPRLNSQSS
ncbi:unnamed protein product, partial [Staurois parvus]